MKTNIWTERKVHIAGQSSNRVLCGSSANARPESRVAHDSVPHGVTCGRCIKAFYARKKVA